MQELVTSPIRFLRMMPVSTFQRVLPWDLTVGVSFLGYFRFVPRDTVVKWLRKSDWLVDITWYSRCHPRTLGCTTRKCPRWFKYITMTREVVRGRRPQLPNYTFQRHDFSFHYKIYQVIGFDLKLIYFKDNLARFTACHCHNFRRHWAGMEHSLNGFITCSNIEPESGGFQAIYKSIGYFCIEMKYVSLNDIHIPFYCHMLFSPDKLGHTARFAEDNLAYFYIRIFLHFR